jgi:hypothetical protein
VLIVVASLGIQTSMADVGPSGGGRSTGETIQLYGGYLGAASSALGIIGAIGTVIRWAIAKIRYTREQKQPDWRLDDGYP